MARILIAAGGTGGHLFPAQQLAELLRSDAEILFAGHKIESSPFFEKEKIPFSEIAAHPLKRGFLSAAWKGFWQSIRLIRRFSPDLVVGFGSYHTFPLLLATAALRKELILFEANCILGKVNRLFLPAASLIAHQFSLAVKKGALVPLLPWKEGEEPVLSQSEARDRFGLDPSALTLLVFGGSQGASFLNEAAPPAAARLKGVQVIHLAGVAEWQAVESAYKKLGIRACVKPFEKKMSEAYAAADFALCRSGASTVAELIRSELPSLLIPYPFAAEGHQKKNGLYLSEEIGGARLVEQSAAGGERIAEELALLKEEIGEKRSRLRAARQQQQERVSLAELIRRRIKLNPRCRL